MAVGFPETSANTSISSSLRCRGMTQCEEACVLFTRKLWCVQGQCGTALDRFPGGCQQLCLLLSDTSLLMFQASSSPSGHSYRETGPLLGGD